MRRPDRGVALDVFDRSHARTDRTRHVRDRRITLHVDELVLLAAGHPPQHQARIDGDGGNLWKLRRFVERQAQPGQCRTGGIAAFAQATGQVHHTIGRAGDAHPGEVLAGNEAAERRVIAQHPAGLTEQVHRRIPAAADQQRVARNRLANTGIHTVEVGDQGLYDAVITPGTGHHRAGTQRNAASLALVPQAVGHLRAGVDHHLDLHPRVGQVEGRRIGAVVGGEHHRRAPDHHAVAVQECSCTVRQHDSGQVVVGEHDGPLVGTGCDEHMAGANTPHPLTGQPGRGGVAEVVGAPLEGEHEAVVVVTERGGALQVSHLGVRRELVDCSLHPFGRSERRRSGRCCRAANRLPRTARPPAPPGRRNAPRSVRRSDRRGRHRRRARRHAHAWRRSVRSPRCRPADPAREDRGRPGRRAARPSTPAASAPGTAPRSAPALRCPRPRPPKYPAGGPV